MAQSTQPSSPPKQNGLHSKKRKRKRNRKSSTSTNNPAPSDIVLAEIKARKETPAQDTRPLREREPETYHIYATSEASDVEGASKGQQPQPGLPKASVREGEAEGTESSEELTPRPADNAHASLPSDKLPTEVQPDETNSLVGAETNGAVHAADTNAIIPEPTATREGRFRCPFKEEYGCKATFAKRKAATRHGAIHTSSFACTVCDKKLSRRDTLDAHMRKHTAIEIASAEAGLKNAEKDTPVEQNGQDMDEHDDNDGDVREATPVLSQIDEINEESSTEFTTPQEASQAERVAQQDESRRASESTAEDEFNARAVQDGNTAQEPSERHSSPKPGVLAEVDEAIVKETPMPKPGLKRKRKAEDASHTQQQRAETSRKRAKRSSDSPTMSTPSNDLERSVSMDDADRPHSRQNTEKIVPKLQQSRQGSIDGWAQKYTPGSKLRHPVFNPKSPAGASVQQVEVVIPRTSQGGPSSTQPTQSLTLESERAASDNELNTDQLESLGWKKAKARKATYTTPKGKKRAESGVHYSTPAGDRSVEADATSDEHEAEPTNIATSVAHRTFLAVNSKKRPREREEESGSGFSEEEPHEPNSERSAKRVRLNGKKASSAVVKGKSENGLGKANGLQRHTGPFSEWEVSKLYDWRDMFCEDYNITHEQFNDIMTDTLQRKAGARWNWPFITKSDFLKEYCNVLPHRDKRSMLRYRERHFQNLAGSKDWTAEDDKELVRLHKELGPKWAEIARRLTRTVDAVSQRWRHKLQLGKVEQGEWSKAEETKFKKVLEQVRKDSGTTADLDEWRIPWTKVSQRMGTRTAQQCSNHWRVLHGVKKNGRWVKVEGLERTPGLSRILTPSKMERRLNGDAVSPGHRRVLSEKFVRSDDEDEGSENEDEESADPEQVLSEEEDSQNPDQGYSEGEEEEAVSQRAQTSFVAEEESETVPDTTRRPTTRNPLTAKTPGKTLGSSQLFAQTQANTSALKAPQTDIRQVEVEDRPSPNIPIQRRVMSSRSPLQELKVKENGDLDLGDGDEGDESEEDAQASDVEHEYEASSAHSEAEEDGEAEAEASVGLDDNEAANAASDASKQLDEEAQDDDESGSETSENAEQAEEADDDDGNEDQDDDDETESPTPEKGSKAKKGALNDFMDSINESARRAKSGWLSRMTGRGSQSQASSQLGKRLSLKEESDDED